MKIKILLPVFLFTALLISSCSGDDDGNNDGPATQFTNVEYNVTSDLVGQTATVTYTNDDGTPRTVNNVPLPFTIEYSANLVLGSTLSLDVTTSVPGGTMSAEIIVNGDSKASGSDTEEINLSTLVN